MLATIARFGRALWHAFLYWREGRPVIAPKGVRQWRERKCGRCRHAHYGFCNLCHCLIAAKTKLASEECPAAPPRWMKL